MWLPWDRRVQAGLPLIDPAAGDDPETNIINFRPPRTIVQEAWRRRAYAVGFALALFLVSLTVLAWQSSPGRTPVKPGDTVVESVRAPRRVTFLSQTRTRISRDQASAQSPAIYDYDSNLLRQFRGRAADLLRNLSAVKADTLLPTEQRRLMVIRLEAGFNGEAVEAILSMDDVDWRVTVGEALRVLDENVRERLRAEQIAERRASIIAQISAQLTEPQQVILTDILTLYLRPNVLVNDVETERVRKEARDRVVPVSVTIEPGEVIVRAGDVITPEDAEKLQALGLGTRAFDAFGLAGVSVYGAVIVTLFTVALGSLYGDILLRPRRLAMIGVVLVGSMVAARLVIPGQPWVAYAFPSAVAIMLVSNLLDAPLAVLVAIVQAALLAPITGYSFELVILFLAKGIVGAIAARRIDRLNAFFIAGLAVAVTNLAVAFAFRLLSSDLDSQVLLNIASGAAVDGVLSAVLTMGSFSLVGSVFGVTTMLQLLELAHPSQPLLRRILTEAPGTYHHSILVGNLAERAAEEIGVDSLLVRVGAYYHDVGKLRRPYYFVENQFDGDNIHHRLSPEASATAIIDHVIHGLELAREYRLPVAVQAFIVEHHGTRLAGFFYREALKVAGADTVDERAFRYPGPRPQRKETALVMLADTVEASVRAASNRSANSLENLVERAVNERILEGELDDSTLTLRDLYTVKRSFVQQLRGVYHRRLDYTDGADAELAISGRRGGELPEREA